MSGTSKVRGMTPVLEVWYLMLSAMASADLGARGAAGAAVALLDTSEKDEVKRGREGKGGGREEEGKGRGREREGGGSRSRESEDGV